MIPFLTALTAHFSCGLFYAFSYLRDFFHIVVDWWKASNLQVGMHQSALAGFEDFYIRRAYLRVQDCFNRPISSPPDTWVDVVERVSNDNNKILNSSQFKKFPKICAPFKNVPCAGIGFAPPPGLPCSYNYLGFAAVDEYCTPRVIQSLKNYYASTCSARIDGGTTSLHAELEQVVANFVRKPAALVTGMGYVTHSAILPVLIGKHLHLEELLRENIVDGQPRTHRPWRKIIVVVEGIYSMEGEICKFPEIVSICKKYKAYVYLDEAHSIGAVGTTGRGVCELLDVDNADVDIMMGTFSKSFGSCSGYIAGSKELTRYLKYTCPAHLYATSISPPAAQQIISSIKVILGEDGTSRGALKLAKAHENSNYFRSKLQKMEFDVLGDYDSPVMPIMIYNPAKIAAFSRECLKRNVAVVTVTFPATPLLLARARICISAAHTQEDMVNALEVIGKVGDMVGIKYLPAEPKKPQLDECRDKVEYFRFKSRKSFRIIPPESVHNVVFKVYLYTCRSWS
ncbi:long chain base biosynthesis protein 2a [Artemisia annua]|uniref:serine C-palmitoyltransferase n=1 Tax=Artemisia annua TaxID=35608 RepID=A0A2U1LJ80_ARTAN|nr:long chain base biosynthesis protein 2a [Artemisia annua]